MELYEVDGKFVFPVVEGDKIISNVIYLIDGDKVLALEFVPAFLWMQHEMLNKVLLIVLEATSDFKEFDPNSGDVGRAESKYRFIKSVS